MVPTSPEWGSSPLRTLQKHDKYGLNSVPVMRIWLVSYLYRPGEWNGKELAVEKMNRENESHKQKSQGLSDPNCLTRTRILD